MQRPERSFKIINQFTSLSYSKFFDGFLLCVCAALHDPAPHFPTLPPPLTCHTPVAPWNFLTGPRMDPAHSHHRCFSELFALPGKPFFPEHSLAHFLIQMSLFKYLLSQRPSQALLAETMNHSILIYLFCSTYLKSYDLLFCLLAWLSPLLQCRFFKSGTFLISPGTGHIVGAQ